MIPRDPAALGDFPLAGTSVLIGRSVEQAEALMKEIGNLGGKVDALPLIDVVVKSDVQTTACIRTAASQSDVVVATSANALRALQRFVREEGILLPPTCYVIGHATATEAATLGCRPVLFPEIRTAQQLAERLITQLSSTEKIFFPHGNLADRILPSLLEAAQHEVISCECYTTQDTVLNLNEVEKKMGRDRAVMILYSPSAVRSLHRQVAETRGMDRVHFISVGPTTAAACEEYGFRVAAIADKPTDEGVLEALVRWVKSPQSVDRS